MSLADIERRLEEINEETHQMIVKAAEESSASKYTEALKALVDETGKLKEKRAFLQELRKNNATAARKNEDAAAIMEQSTALITTWDESVIRQLVDSVKVLSKDQIEVYLRGGIAVKQNMS